MQQTPPPAAGHTSSNSDGLFFALGIVLGLFVGGIAGVALTLWGYSLLDVKHIGWMGIGFDLVGIGLAVLGFRLMVKGVKFLNGLLVGLGIGMLGPLMTCGLVFFGEL